MNNDLPTPSVSGMPAAPNSYGSTPASSGKAGRPLSSSSSSKEPTNATDHALWAAKIDALIAETANNPRKRAEGLAQLKAQYLYEMFGVQLKVKE